MKRWGPGILIAFVWGLLSGMILAGRYDSLSMAQVLFAIGRYNENFIPVEVLNFMIDLLPYFVFQIIYGTEIYRRFCTASVYYFSRCANRRRWYWWETARLFPITLAFPIAMLVGCWLGTLTGAAVEVTGAEWLLAGYWILITALWLYCMTLCVNLLSVKFGSSAGFSVVEGIELLCVGALLLWEKVLPLDSELHALRNAGLLIANPISHLVLGWHSSAHPEVNALIGSIGISFDLNLSLAILIGVATIVLLAGQQMVQRQEFLVVNRETGGT